MMEGALMGTKYKQIVSYVPAELHRKIQTVQENSPHRVSFSAIIESILRKHFERGGKVKS